MGGNGGIIIRSYSTGSVRGRAPVGGFVGEANRLGGIKNSYSTGAVNGNGGVGGLVGFQDGGSITSSFWDTQTSGMTASDGGTGLSTSQLQQQSTFTDWDFINVWNIGENQTYPYLRTHATSDINKDNITNFLDLCIVAEQWMDVEH